MTRKMDCKDYGCGECQVCRYLNFREWATSCAPPGSTIERNEKVEAYLDKNYPHWRGGKNTAPAQKEGSDRE